MSMSQLNGRTKAQAREGSPYQIHEHPIQDPWHYPFGQPRMSWLLVEGEVNYEPGHEDAAGVFTKQPRIIALSRTRTYISPYPHLPSRTDTYTHNTFIFYLEPSVPLSFHRPSIPGQGSPLIPISASRLRSSTSRLLQLSY
ncbi:hypothetical protein CRG98_009543 [Punica granatum]|uniref:Uncharacterized protein n=1 Tax=Punica granatum TaxID=22663 RepID=A0A2I0KP25_PUNGR|nr:hypothetical protein CRG98_009543 [Punica granatum]